ncbi:MAG: hypothetical protein M1840_000507 [Geoglossum simile]|nr:MAG: hypothetical protein M1840_000507 [Geoglossum simile]
MPLPPIIPVRQSSSAAIAQQRLQIRESRETLKRKLSETSFEDGPKQVQTNQPSQPTRKAQPDQIQRHSGHDIRIDQFPWLDLDNPQTISLVDAFIQQMIASPRDVGVLQDDFNHDDYMQYLNDYDCQYGREVPGPPEDAGGSPEDNTPLQAGPHALGTFMYIHSCLCYFTSFASISAIAISFRGNRATTSLVLSDPFRIICYNGKGLTLLWGRTIFGKKSIKN